jgi:BMFP domain-containing protein YqiC
MADDPKDPLPATSSMLEKRIAELEAKLAETSKSEPEERAKLMARIAQLEARIEAKKEDPPASPPPKSGFFPRLF